MLFELFVCRYIRLNMFMRRNESMTTEEQDGGGRRCYDPDAPISEDVGNRAIIEQNNSTSASFFSRIITSSIIKIKDHQAQGLSRKVLEYFHCICNFFLEEFLAFVI